MKRRKAAPLQVQANHLSDEELRVRCAWLYYVGDMSQASVAEQLGVTRARVNKLVAEAREMGIVSISVNAIDEATGTLLAGKSIADRWGLDFCIVTPPLGLRPAKVRDEGLEEVHRRIARRAVGMAAAEFLRGRLAAGEPLTVGVGWGRTIEQMAVHLHGVSNVQAKFVSVMGSFTRNAASNPFEVVHTLASRTGGEGHFIPVPFVADTQRDLKVFMSQRLVRDAVDLVRNADFIITSLGELKRHSIVLRQGMLRGDEYDSLIAAGAVGDLLGRFFDATGRPVDHELNRRTAAVTAAEVKGVPLVLLAAGADKIRPLRALLEAKLIHALVIDGDAAGQLLAE